MAAAYVLSCKPWPSHWPWASFLMGKGSWGPKQLICDFRRVMYRYKSCSFWPANSKFVHLKLQMCLYCQTDYCTEDHWDEEDDMHVSGCPDNSALKKKSKGVGVGITSRKYVAKSLLISRDRILWKMYHGGNHFIFMHKYCKSISQKFLIALCGWPIAANVQSFSILDKLFTGVFFAAALCIADAEGVSFKCMRKLHHFS